MSAVLVALLLPLLLAGAAAFAWWAPPTPLAQPVFLRGEALLAEELRGYALVRRFQPRRGWAINRAACLHLRNASRGDLRVGLADGAAPCAWTRSRAVQAQQPAPRPAACSLVVLRPGDSVLLPRGTLYATPARVVATAHHDARSLLDWALVSVRGG
jgi:hypothetical protein